MEDVVGWFELVFIYVDGVAHGLECIKANTNWKDQNEGRHCGPKLNIHSKDRKQGGNVVSKKTTIFEDHQGADVSKNRKGQKELFSPWFCFHSQTGKEVQQATGNDQEQKTPIPPTIKNEGTDHEEQVAQVASGLYQRPQGKEYGGKDQKYQRVKKHGFLQRLCQIGSGFHRTMYNKGVKINTPVYNAPLIS